MGILQARILEWVATHSSWGSSQSRDLTQISHIAGRFFLYHLSHQGRPKILEWVAYFFSRASSWPRNRTRVSCTAGGFFTSWVTREALVANDLLLKQRLKKKDLKIKDKEIWPCRNGHKVCSCNSLALVALTSHWRISTTEGMLPTLSVSQAPLSIAIAGRM